MENENNKYNKIVTIILIIFIVLMIIGNFILSDKPFTITAEIIVCLSLLVILCLADSFDNLSIPKLISLSKNIKEVKKDNENLKETNLRLIEQMINIKNTNNQFMCMPGSFTTVGSSNIDDIGTKKNEEVESDDVENENHTDTSLAERRNRYADRFKYIKNLEVFLLKKVIMNDINKYEIQYDVKVTNNKPIKDNIMKNETRFDALKSDGKSSVFYEVKISPQFVNFYYELYYKLKLVELYGEINECDSKLVLIIPKIDEELEKIIGDARRWKYLKERIYQRFDPAINNDLLEIKEIDVSKDELDDYINKKENNK